MIGKKKGEDINDMLQGPVGILALGIGIISIVLAISKSMETDAVQPDEFILFGGFIQNIIAELMFYAYSLIPLIIVVGGLMVGLALKIHPNNAIHLTMHVKKIIHR